MCYMDQGFPGSPDFVTKESIEINNNKLAKAMALHETDCYSPRELRKVAEAFALPPFYRDKHGNIYCYKCDELIKVPSAKKGQ